MARLVCEAWLVRNASQPTTNIELTTVRAHDVFEGVNHFLAVAVAVFGSRKASPAQPSIPMPSAVKPGAVL